MHNRARINDKSLPKTPISDLTSDRGRFMAGGKCRFFTLRIANDYSSSNGLRAAGAAQQRSTGIVLQIGLSRFLIPPNLTVALYRYAALDILGGF